MIDALDKLAPEDADYRHNAEGSDDMVSHLDPSSPAVRLEALLLTDSLHISSPSWQGQVYPYPFQAGNWDWELGKEYISVNSGNLLIDVLL
jgi:hypothetical protein